MKISELDKILQDVRYRRIRTMEARVKILTLIEEDEAINYSRCCKSDSEQLVCDHEWIHNTHSDTKYCRKGCDGFKIHEAN